MAQNNYPSEEINIEFCLKELAKKRKVFHSEADFQFALAWEIQSQYNDAGIRLEYPCKLREDEKESNSFIDIVIHYKGKKIPIELKYKTKEMHIVLNDDENYNLRNHAGQPQVRYDFLKDIQRIENLTQKHPNFYKGYTIWLTNNKCYWESNCKGGTSENFSIHNGAVKSGKMEWCKKPASGTIKGREEPINLKGTYTINWEDYSRTDNNDKECIFKYAISTIEKSK